jgi:putative DNA primase/helicase
MQRPATATAKIKKTPVRKATAPPKTNKQTSEAEKPTIQVPDELKELDQWLCWEKIPIPGKERFQKKPFDPATGKSRGWNNPGSSTSYEVAHKRYMKGGKADGISLLLTDGDQFVGFDFDDIINPDDPAFIPPAIAGILDDLLTYIEISPSGTGLRAIGKITKEKPAGKKLDFSGELGVEIFLRSPVTMTGEVYQPEKYGTEIRDCTEQLHKLIEKGWELKGKSKEEENDFDPDDFVAFKPPLSDEEVIEKVKEKCPDLWDGDHSAYASQSEGDLALCGEIAKWTEKKPDRIDSIFRESGLFREKWDVIHSRDKKTYGEMTIAKALEGTTWVYGENLLNRVILPVEDFSALKVEPKKMILHPWLAENSVTMIAGLPGIGKSMLVQSLLISITHGQGFGPFKVETPVPCLFLDGEMPTQTVQERLALLSPGGKAKQPFYIYSDAYASTLEGVPPANLLEEKWRDQMTQMLMELGVKVFAIDNLVSLSPGIDEDRKVDYDPINQWLKQLRYKGIAVILVHHTGKSGDQRGTSAREDNVDVVILLKRPQGYCSHHGVRFKMNMRKARNMRPQELRFIRDTVFQLEEVTKGKLAWKFDSTREDLIKEVVKLVGAGVRNVDIADDLDIDPSYVSTIKARSIVKWKWLNSDGSLTEAGKRYCGSTGTEEEEEDF